MKLHVPVCECLHYLHTVSSASKKKKKEERGKEEEGRRRVDGYHRIDCVPIRVVQIVYRAVLLHVLKDCLTRERALRNNES